MCGCETVSSDKEGSQISSKTEKTSEQNELEEIIPPPGFSQGNGPEGTY